MLSSSELSALIGSSSPDRKGSFPHLPLEVAYLEKTLTEFSACTADVLPLSIALPLSTLRKEQDKYERAVAPLDRD